jgi:hypothetical protein
MAAQHTIDILSASAKALSLAIAHHLSDAATAEAASLCCLGRYCKLAAVCSL